MEGRRPFCADVSLESAEPIAATASRVDHWILVEYRGPWGHDAIASSGLPGEVKAHLRQRARDLGRTKVLFVRRPGRRGRGGLSVFWGSSAERGARLFRAEIESYEQLLELDFSAAGEPLAYPLLLVCTHGKHDRCCARHGRPLYQALREQVDERWLWQSSHVGGDRFAANLVCLPEGLYFGRVEPAEAWPVLDDYLAGRIHLSRYRGRCCYGFPVQAAELRVREESRLAGVADLTLLAVARDGAGWRVRFRGGGRDYDVSVAAERGELTYLTCTAATLTHPPRYVARSLRESAS